MPKDRLSHSEWIRRLRLYANGEYVFGCGHAPPPNSQWAKKRALIDTCPVKKARTDVFGNRTTCNCGFHYNYVSMQVSWCFSNFLLFFLNKVNAVNTFWLYLIFIDWFMLNCSSQPKHTCLWLWQVLHHHHHQCCIAHLPPVLCLQR